MERYRIEWHDGPRLVGGDTWVVDLDLLMSIGGSPFRFAKRLQVVATDDDLGQAGRDAPDWMLWRALVAVAVGIIIRRVDADELHLERPRVPLQIAPDITEAIARSDAMTPEPAVASELVSEFGAG
jgi:hypothetical protein